MGCAMHFQREGAEPGNTQDGHPLSKLCKSRGQRALVQTYHFAVSCIKGFYYFNK